ncbi:hypothetical protein Pelo_1514 [Pelomyxa schiedti]|nr:hypothetical protein Pelo_1514 [Pelomyxa schiedti]
MYNQPAATIVTTSTGTQLDDDAMTTSTTGSNGPITTSTLPGNGDPQAQAAVDAATNSPIPPVPSSPPLPLPPSSLSSSATLPGSTTVSATMPPPSVPQVQQPHQTSPLANSPPGLLQYVVNGVGLVDLPTTPTPPPPLPRSSSMLDSEETQEPSSLALMGMGMPLVGFSTGTTIGTGTGNGDVTPLPLGVVNNLNDGTGGGVVDTCTTSGNVPSVKKKHSDVKGKMKHKGLKAEKAGTPPKSKKSKKTTKSSSPSRHPTGSKSKKSQATTTNTTSTTTDTTDSAATTTINATATADNAPATSSNTTEATSTAAPATEKTEPKPKSPTKKKKSAKSTQESKEDTKTSTPQRSRRKIATPSPSPGVSTRATQVSPAFFALDTPRTRRVCRQLGSKVMGASDVSLQDFLDEKLIIPGQEISYSGPGKCPSCTVTKHGWLNTDNSTFPNIELWLQASAVGTTARKAVQNTVDLWSLASTKKNRLSEMRDHYLDIKAEIAAESSRPKRFRDVVADKEQDEDIPESTPDTATVGESDSQFIPPSQDFEESEPGPLASEASLTPTPASTEEKAPSTKKAPEVQKKDKEPAPMSPPNNDERSPPLPSTLQALLNREPPKVPLFVAETQEAGEYCPTPAKPDYSNYGEETQAPDMFSNDLPVGGGYYTPQSSNQPPTTSNNIVEESQFNTEMVNKIMEKAEHELVDKSHAASPPSVVQQPSRRVQPEPVAVFKQPALPVPSVEPAVREATRCPPKKSKIARTPSPQPVAAAAAESAANKPPKVNESIPPEKPQPKPHQPPSPPQQPQKRAPEPTSIQQPASAPVNKKPKVAVESTSVVSSSKSGSRSNYVILPTSVRGNLLVHLRMTVEKCGGRVVANMSSEVTHVVAIVNPSTTRVEEMSFKYACAVLAGCWIVSFDWVMHSFNAGKWLDETRYEVSGDPNALGAPKKGRRHKENILSGAPDVGLFTNHSFFFSPRIDPMVCTRLAELVHIGKGEVLKETPSPPTNITELRESAATTGKIIHVVGDKLCSMEDAKKLYLQTGRPPLSYDWVLQCVSEFRVVDTSRYIVDVVSGDDIAALEAQDSLAF